MSNQVENRLIGFTSKFRFILVQQYGAVQYYRVTLAVDLGTSAKVPISSAMKKATRLAEFLDEETSLLCRYGKLLI